MDGGWGGGWGGGGRGVGAHWAPGSPPRRREVGECDQVHGPQSSCRGIVLPACYDAQRPRTCDVTVWGHVGVETAGRRQRSKATRHAIKVFIL